MSAPYTAPQVAMATRLNSFGVLFGVSFIVVILTRFMAPSGSPFVFVWLAFFLTPAVTRGWCLRAIEDFRTPRRSFGVLVVRSFRHALLATAAAVAVFFVFGLFLPGGYVGVSFLLFRTLLRLSAAVWLGNVVGIIPLFVGTFIALCVSDEILRQNDCFISKDEVHKISSRLTQGPGSSA